MTVIEPNIESSGKAHNWLITLTLIFISFFGVILALVCIFSLPDGTVRPLQGSLFYISGSFIIIALLFLRWKKEKAQENRIYSDTQNEAQKIVTRENVSDKIIKWIVTIYSFMFAFWGLAIALICIFALPDKSVQPKVGSIYFLASAAILSSFIFAVWKNWITKRP